jgi:cytochrome b561
MSEAPPMYIPTQVLDDINTERQQRYPDTPRHSHEEEEEYVSITHKALYLLLVLIIVVNFYLLAELKQDLKNFKTETFFILESISEQIKPTTWEIVPSS